MAEYTETKTRIVSVIMEGVAVRRWALEVTALKLYGNKIEEREESEGFVVSQG